jgi:MFS family permease
MVFLCQASLLLHTVPLLTDRGLTLSIASLVLSITAGVGTVGKLTMGAIADRLSAKYVLSLCFVLQVVGILILMVAGTSWAIWLYAVVFGMGMGGVIAVQPAIIGECFGIRSFGLVFGTMQIFTASFNALGPVLAGWIYDTAGSYFWALVFCGVCGTASAATILLVRQPKRKAARPALQVSEG